MLVDVVKRRMKKKKRSFDTFCNVSSVKYCCDVLLPYVKTSVLQFRITPCFLHELRSQLSTRRDDYMMAAGQKKGVPAASVKFRTKQEKDGRDTRTFG
ncbi:hypothetical protein GQ457_02G008400 [Hibiscus cannabinus]